MGGGGLCSYLLEQNKNETLDSIVHAQEAEHALVCPRYAARNSAKFVACVGPARGRAKTGSARASPSVWSKNTTQTRRNLKSVIY